MATININNIACVVPARNGCESLRQLFLSIRNQVIPFDLFIVDSSSTDGSVSFARKHGAHVHVIPVSEFNHGGTRQMMVDRLQQYDVFIFLTQDAYLEDNVAIERLVAPFNDLAVGAVCGRQLPHIDANPWAEHARLFNYPPESRVKSMGDAVEFGIKTPFISNSFAAYRREALLDVGGFPKHAILSEDMYVAARMLLKGWKVAYAGNASARHSHNYTMMEEFRRYFDTGVFHAREPWIREQFGQAGGEGLRYVQSELRFLGLRRLHLWPSSLLRNALKLVGYKLGFAESKLPTGLKKRLSMHWRYWEGTHA
ncbi:glycosyltransferase [Thiohalomonas denitrificans]|uniref:Rhamnosyltransferase n=1 Tax=Thiohalomonas denitrificans TaxID=415747 RepID=A0A1G5QZS3_9GAMM|nr:glycosyltransferase family 2 protein [Thiohalomonas denitrificans]SCZ67364.1 rhamnosyltransferase [Thiohalomonas denitrificans]